MNIGNNMANVFHAQQATRPANIAISEKMTSQETGLAQGSENAEDAVNLGKTAEGGLDAVTEGLQQIRELAVQASNGTLNGDDKAAIQQEIEGLKEGINDAIKNTEFNTIKVLDEGFNGNVQTGANANQGRAMQIENTSLETLGIENFDVTGDFDIGDIDKAIETVSGERASIGAQTNGLESSIRSNDVARENTLASQNNLDEDFEKEIMEMKKSQVINQYQIQAQRQQMDMMKQNQLSVLG